MKRLKSPNILSYVVVCTLFLLALSSTLLPSCTSSTGSETTKPYLDPSFSNWVSSYTAGTISGTSSIIIRLAREVTDEYYNQSPPEGLLTLSPAVEGDLHWLDKQTVEFRPSQRMAPGSQFTVKFQLAELMEVPDDMAFFEYHVKTQEQNYDLRIENLATTDLKTLKTQKLIGTLITADMAEDEGVEKMLTAAQGDQSLPVTWEHNTDGQNHRFIIENISRMEEESEVLLQINGTSIGADKRDELKVPVPALDHFSVLDLYVVQGGTQHVVVRFSDPIDDKQDLSGLITIAGLRDLTYEVSSNEVSVFPAVKQTGNKNLRISAGIKNILGYKVKSGLEREIAFEQLKPEVRLVGKGNIIPGSEGLIFPFEAVGLKAVELTILRVYENNVSQFLQVNNMAGNREMRRVGRPVLKQLVRLDEGAADLDRWSRYTLDMAEYIQGEPGAIYQVSLGFGKQHSAFFCGEENEQPLEDISIDEDEWNAPSENDESSYWDNYGDYYYDYDWEERDNPCSNSYYGDRRTVRQNILASNLGLIAKMGNSGELFVAVTNILTAQPLAKINIQALDFQQKSIGEGTTDDNGWLRLSLDTKPFLIIADDGQQKGYLKVDDGSSLSLSSFDIGGSRVQKGLKGFLYGERGVWRPGDSLYITFILEDKETVLPEGHPVVFEMYDPLGKLTTRMVNTQGKNGFYSFRTKTEEQAITGNWMGKVKVGGAEFNKSLKIETVKPNRLKINLDFEQDIITSEERYLEGQLEVKWLHGAPGRNLRTSFDVLLTSGKTTFPGYEEFQFDNPENRYYSEQNTVYDGRVDEDGLANVSLSIHAENNPPGMLNALFMGKAWEPGGDFSINNFSIPFYPYKSFTGIRTPKGDKARGMLLTDTTHTIEIATVDAMGDPVSSDAVYVELFKLDWRWWWDQGSSGANYISGNSKTKLSGGSIETRNGKGTWQFRVDYPDWGRYYLKACDNNSGHCTGKVIYIDWPGWAGRAERDNPGGASMLSFSADKRDYKVGEQVRLDIPGSAKGRALISVETGSKVLNTYWLETQSGENTFMIEATPDMAPGAYIHVTMIQEHAQTINDLPIRMYGVIPVFVNDPQTVLQPQLAMADALAPGEKVNLEISEVSGKPMTYTIAVVDEGLLDLTNYRTPDPWSVFYAREALGVKTWDLYEFVMGAYGGKLERLLAIGGGEGEAGDSKGKVNRFKPVVKYLGPFELKQGASNKHNFTMPQYVGAVKTMVIAGHDGAYGKTEKSTPVKQPVMVLGTLPRVLGPGERVDLPVNIFAMEEDIKQVTVQVSASDILSSTGSESRTVSFQRVGDQTVSFSYQVADRLGTGKVKITAKAGNYSATHEIEIAVRNPNPLVTNFDQSLINAGETWSTEYAFPGIAGTNSGLLEISSIPPIDFGRRLKYLISYPHGCIEQTTSSVFPQLFISDIMQTDEKQKVQMEQNIKAGISRIRQFQLPNGGLAYWPGNAHADIWGTNYAGHFLLVAREKGYDVPPSVIRKWKSFQSKEASQWRKHPSNQRDDLIQAYRLYTLALEGSPEKGAMNRLRESKNLSVQAAWRLAAAYALAGQPEAAKELIKNRTFQIAEYSEQGQSFGTALRDKAMILETLGLLKAFNRGGELLLDISKELSKTNLWLSTQTTAYCLIGVGQFAGMSKNGKGLNFTYALNNETKDAKTDLPMSQIPIDTKNMTGNISVTNKGTGLLYARLALTGAPARGAETDSETNLRMTVKYTDMDGYSIDPESLEQGTSFLAEVSIMNTGLKGNYENLALTQIFPSGWEIINLRLADTNLSQSDFDYQDIRDDRVYTYFDLRANQRKKFSVVLNASYVGAYYLPAVSCEAMYDKSVSSVKKGMEVNVVRPGEL